jgi:poly(A) polymerase
MPRNNETHARATGDWLTCHETRAVLAALIQAGFEARIVGGAVRNTLLNLPVSDIDIATTAEPEQTIAAVCAAGLRAIPTGLQHGTITVVSSGHTFEVTTLRRDVETDGRHARVAFTADWTADARRRDFTINALYCDADGVVCDPVGGLADLDPPRIRFIGDAHERIREDYLRILRFFRFTAAYSDGVLDPHGLAACIAERAGLAQISAERIRAEILKLLVARHAVPVVDTMMHQGFVDHCLGLADRTGYRRHIGIFARLIALEQSLGRAPDPILRLAALVPEAFEGAQDVAAGARDVARTLHLSNAERAQLVALAHCEMGHTPVPNARLARRALQADGVDMFRARVLFQWAIRGASLDAPDWRELYLLPDRWTAPQLPLSGKDLLAAGVAPGPAFGQLLRELDAWWIEQDFAPDRESVRRELKRRLGAGTT